MVEARRGPHIDVALLEGRWPGYTLSCGQIMAEAGRSAVSGWVSIARGTGSHPGTSPSTRFRRAMRRRIALGGHRIADAVRAALMPQGG